MRECLDVLGQLEGPIAQPTDARACLVGRERQRLAQGVELHRQGRHPLTDVVVELSGDSPALGLVRLYQTSLDVLRAWRVIARNDHQPFLPHRICET